MKTTLTKKQISEILKHVNPVINKKTTLPILECVKFSSRKAQGKGLHITTSQLVVTATDLEQNIDVYIDTEILDNNESFLVPVDLLKQVKKSLKKNQWLSIENEGQEKLILKFNNMEKTEETLSTEEWPETKHNVEFCDVVADKFMSLYHKAVNFTSTDKSRHVLRGVFADSENQNLVGSDGKRMVAFDMKNLPCKNIIPPHKFLNKKSVMKNLESAQIGMSEELFTLQTQTYTYSCKTTIGEYPNWKQVIPDTAEPTAKMRFAREDIKTIADIAEMLTKHFRCLNIATENKKIAVKGVEANVSAALQGSSNNNITISVNAEFLLDILRTGFSDMKLLDDKTPVVFENDTGIAVLMPLSEPVSNQVANELSELIRKNDRKQ